MGLGEDRQSERRACSPHHGSPNPIYPHHAVFLALPLQASSIYSAAAECCAGSEVMPSSLTWSSCANAIAKICGVVGFIEGYPKFHFISQSLEKDLSIFLKPLNYSIILPPTNVLQCLWEVPMIESYL